MELDRWTKIHNLFQSARERPAGERDGYLRDACAGDEVLEREVRSLLAAQQRAGSFLLSPAIDVAAQAIAGEDEAPPSIDGAVSARRALPARIGGFQILSVLGEGGMGVVYEAVQERPRRVVALKVVKPGLEGALLRRFEHESLALARLQHPGIAQIYEAGVADAGFGPQPYFAMEFIRGVPLREYVKTRNLNVRETVTLIVKICRAVEHAHQRGLIHRDLKPGNILVDETNQPKILDFGVALVTDSEAQVSRQTDIGQLVGTLEYMSPEQVLADPMEVDTRSDVYALGMILYELLAGHRPYKLSPHLHEAVHTIREEEPAPLSSVSREYRGDLETIGAKALEKEKARRYGSAAALADDIEHYLADEPISARPPSAAYQLKKFARRHKAFAGSVAAVFAVLFAGIVVSTREYVQAKRAQQTAQVEAATAKAVNDFLQNDVLAQASAATQSSPNNRPDPELKVRTALDRAAATIPGKFVSQPLVEASIRHTIAGAYADLGLIPQSQEQLARVLELRRHFLGGEHPDTLSTMNDLAMLYQRQGKYTESESLQVEALETRRRLFGYKDLHTLIEMGNLAFLYMNEGKFAPAEELLTTVLKQQRQRIGDQHTDTLFTMSNLALLYRNEGKYVESEPLAERVLQARTRILGQEHPDTLASMSILAQVYQGEGRYGDAEPLFIKVLEARRRVLGGEHFSTLVSMNYLADLYRIEGKDSQAEALYIPLLGGRRRALGPNHPDTIKVLEALGRMRLDQHNYTQAEELLREAVSVREKISPDVWQGFDNQSMLGAALAGEKRYGTAEPLLISGYEGLVRRGATIPNSSHFAVKQAGERIVQLYLAWGKSGKAAEWRTRIQ